MNFVVFLVGTTLLALGISDVNRDYERLGLPLVTLLFTLCIFSVLEKPIRAYCDTILVCFAEAPEQLKSSARELYDLLAEFYGTALAKLCV
jgi:hypothetical protein